jgi:hypothetical protein
MGSVEGKRVHASNKTETSPGNGTPLQHNINFPARKPRIVMQFNNSLVSFHQVPITAGYTFGVMQGHSTFVLSIPNTQHCVPKYDLI